MDLVCQKKIKGSRINVGGRDRRKRDREAMGQENHNNRNTPKPAKSEFRDLQVNCTLKYEQY